MSLVRDGRERSRTIRWPRLSSGRSARRRRTPPIGRCARWPGKAAFRTRDLAHLGRLRLAAAPLGDVQAAGDPHFVDKVRDIIGLYLSPPDRALVLCVDEKSQIQALDRTQPVLPMLPGMPQAPRNDLAVRSPRCRHGFRHRQVLQAPPGQGVSRLPEGDRPTRSRRAGHPHRHGQLRHPQDGGSQSLAGTAAPGDFTPTSASWPNAGSPLQLQRGVHTSTRHSRYPGLHRKTHRRPQALQVVILAASIDQNLCRAQVTSDRSDR